MLLLAKPTTALLPFRATPSAFISSSASKSATTQVTPSHNAEGPPLSVTGKPRREVPLPSQEKKEGAMQYALYVLQALRLWVSFDEMLMVDATERQWIRLQIGPVKVPSGP